MFVRLESLPASRTRHTRTSGLTPRQTDNRKAYPSGLVLYLSLGLAETPPIHSTPIFSGLTVTLPIESAYAMNVFQNDCLSPVDRYRHNCLRGGMEEMTSPGGSTLPIPRRYPCPYPSIVPFEGCDYAHRSTGYTHSL